MCGGHDYSLDVTLVVDEDTNLINGYGEGTLLVGYEFQEYNLRFEGSFTVDGVVLDTSEWVGYLQLTDSIPGYDQVVLRLYYSTSPSDTHTSVSLYWSGVIWGTEVVQVNMVYP